MIGLIILIALPLIEIAVLIKAGQWVGFWPVLGVVIATFVLGSAILGRSGLSSAMKVREALARGEPPVGAMLDSAMVVVAAILLITPGLIADAIGLMLLIPPVRQVLAHIALRNAIVVGTVKTQRGRFDEDERPHPHSPDRPPGAGSDGPVIEGEFERLDERPVNGSRSRPNGRQE
ncbi:MAG: FxsA family protein [Hyphomicrobiaceae bacterium]